MIASDDDLLLEARERSEWSALDAELDAADVDPGDEGGDEMDLSTGLGGMGDLSAHLCSSKRRGRVKA
jgi:hypothetical protein